MNEPDLTEGEEILYTCYGNFSHHIFEVTQSGKFKIPVGFFGLRVPVVVSVKMADIIITNKRIITQGETKVKVKIMVVAPSITGELPRDGYEIPIKNVGNLKKKRNRVFFLVRDCDHPGIIIIKFLRRLGELKENYDEDINRLFEILSEFKGEDISQSFPKMIVRIICIFVIIFSIVFFLLILFQLFDLSTQS